MKASAVVGALAVAWIAGPAQALSIMAPIGQGLTAGGNYAGQFDISSYLAGHQVVSATVTAFGASSYSPTAQILPYGTAQFLSSQDVVVVPGYYTYEGLCVFGGCYVPPVMGEDRYYARHRDQMFFDPLDVMVLDVGDGSGLATTARIQSLGAYYQIGFGSEGRNDTGGTNRVTYYQRDIVDAYSGPLSASADLSVNDLADLNGDGLLDFSVAAQQGGFVVTYARLDLALAAVPEPATWALMILGFGGAGAMLRRRRSFAI